MSSLFSGIFLFVHPALGLQLSAPPDSGPMTIPTTETTIERNRCYPVGLKAGGESIQRRLTVWSTVTFESIVVS